jgi:phosphatidate cytidylyltransferase
MTLLNQVHPNLLMAGVGIVCLLVIATIIILILKKLSPDKDYTELVLRIKSWWMMSGVFLFVLLIGKTVSIVFFSVLSFLALKEYFSLIPTRRADRRTLFWAYLSIPFQYYWVSIGWYGMFIIFIPVYVFLFLPFRLVISKETRGFLKSTSAIHWGVMTMVYCLSHHVYLLALPNENNPNGGSAALLLFLVFLTEGNDILQYIWGKLFGKKKIAPSISPNKTIVGFVGASVTIIFVSYLLAPLLTPLSMMHSLIIGLLISCVGFIGDIVISALKRDLQVKDSGSLIPGHGGILDRVDSLIYTAPIFFHFIRYFYY